MRKKTLYFLRNNILLLVLLCVFLVLIFYRLDNSYLWKDEAGTANVSYNIMSQGVPSVYDGKNLLTTTDGNNFNDLLLVSNHDWLQYYICAGSFFLFGKNTFAARFPFAFFSFVSIVVIWFIAKRIWGQRKCANLACFLYGINVQFLLYARQARYYSLSLFFTALSILLVFKLLEIIDNENILKQRYGWVSVLLACSVGLLFFSNRLSGIIFVGSLVLYLLYLHKKILFKMLIPVGCGMIPYVGWFIINNIIFEAPSFGGNAIESHMFSKLLLVVWKLQVYFIPFISLFVIILAIKFFNFVLGRRERQIFNNKEYFLFIALIISNICVTIVPKWGIVNHYYLPVLIATPFILVYVLRYIWRSSKTIAVTILLLIVMTNVLNVFPYELLDEVPDEKNEVNNLLSEDQAWTTNYGIFASPDTDANFRITPLNSFLSTMTYRSYLFDYFRELQYGYYSPVQEIVEYVNKQSSPDDTMLVVGMEYEPIIFYTDLRVVNNLSTKFSPWSDFFPSYPNQEKYEHLTRVSDEEIDWIVLKKGMSVDLFFDDPRYLEKNRDLFDIYESQTSDIDLSTSADLDYHKFETVYDGESFTIWHRIKGGKDGS